MSPDEKGALAPVTLPPVDREQAALPATGGHHAERLERLRVLGRGGMGEIHAARDPVLARDVALKVMLRTTSRRWARRFATEARVTAQLDHPNIVPVYDADLDDDGQLAYSMKLVAGDTLTEVLAASAQARRRGGVVPPDLALDALLDHFAKLCDAIAYAHDKGVVHRDLKPDNIMIGGHGEVYVMDWGLARVLGDADVLGMPEGNATLPGYALGTAAYMAPEQATGQPMGPPCDQYALGLILYEMVCGRPARQNTTELQQGLELAASGRLQPIVGLGSATVRRELAGILRKATQLDPDARYASMGDLADDLRRFRANRPVVAAPDSLVQGAQRWLSSHREATLRLVLVMVLLLVVAATGVSVVALGGAGLYAQWAERREARLTELVTRVGSQAAELEQALALIHSQVEGVAASSRVLLTHAAALPEREVLAPSVFESSAAPPDTAYSPSYDRLISTQWPDIVIAPGVDRPVAVDQARRLVPVRHAMRRAHMTTRQVLGGLDPVEAEAAWRDDPGPLRWAIVGTPEGLYLEMPGAAWNVTGFDGRVRPWYTLATEPRPIWSRPYQEASTGTLLVACSMQIPDEDGDMLGVASLSVSFTYLADRYLHLDHPAVEETYLVDDQARIMLRSELAAPDDRPDRLDDIYDTPPFPDPALQAALGPSAGMVQGEDGSLLLHYPLRNGWWYVARVDPSLAVSTAP